MIRITNSLEFDKDSDPCSKSPATRPLYSFKFRHEIDTLLLLVYDNVKLPVNKM